MTDVLIRRSDSFGDGVLPDLRAEFRFGDGVCLFELTGQLTKQLLHVLDIQVGKIARATFDTLVLELSGVLSIDQAGADALLDLQRYATARGAQLVICGATFDTAIALYEAGAYDYSTAP